MNYLALGALGALRQLAALFLLLAALLLTQSAQAAPMSSMDTVDASTSSVPTSVLPLAPVVDLAPDDAAQLGGQALRAVDARDWTSAAIAFCVLFAWALRRFTYPLSWAHTRGAALGIAAVSGVASAIAHALSGGVHTPASLVTVGVLAAVMALAAATNPTTLSTQARAATDPTLALLLVFLLVVPNVAHADDPPPPPLPPVAAHVVLPAPAAPDPAPIPAAALAGKLTIARNQLEALAEQLGVPVPKTLPAAFWDTTPGKVVSWTLFGMGIAAASAQTGISIWQTVH